MTSLAGKRVAVSLGASFMGYATHAGFLAGLVEGGLRPVALGGSSAGAIAAGLHAAGLGTDVIRQAVTGTELPLSFIRATKWGWQQVGDIFSRRQPAWFDTRAAVDYFEQLTGARRIEELPGPRLIVGMTDMQAREAIFARSGSLALAMTASSAMPLMFTDVEWEGRRVCDGGVMHEAPMDPWLEDDGIDAIVIHRIPQPHQRAPWFIPSRIIHTLACAHHCSNSQWLADRAAMARLHGKELIVLTTTGTKPSIWSRSSRESCYSAGEATARAFIQSHLT
ncbi:MAG: patatin-like phospholipase family protein [Verrucomicrobiaceae bacterium]|nr:patatin-like phospholipase family protein [Verrucomicrobiaceae bacterium]